ncbi:hypothetical protein SAMN05216201_107106 [Pseudomonas linyingensis]|uniref:TubC N-terminal docking domain-containing protein n=1 Tax=Pseudomonas linyingensis TaxID=915471 RepID=A0A1H6Y0R9_9PSED|nr:hypothetical protein [Pseudomonas linyingensis]SEJ34046.1 hypothetical protein SAMN05216201_107106 [Pseudomonas linyingensis]
MAALDYLRRVGLSVEAVGDKLRVTPANLVTDAIGQFVRDHKAEILVELAGTDASQVADTIRSSPAWIDRPQRIEQPVEIRVEEEEGKPQRIIHTAATASPAWLEADAAYTNHLMTCRACHAATGRYCASGADLRQRYIATQMEASE